MARVSSRARLRSRSLMPTPFWPRICARESVAVADRPSSRPDDWDAGCDAKFARRSGRRHATTDGVTGGATYAANDRTTDGAADSVARGRAPPRNVAGQAI